MVARIAKEISRGEKAETKILEESFISGILHDIGKLILLKTPVKCRKVKEFVEMTGGSALDAEYAVLRTSHAELGAYLLGLWGLPDNIVETIAFHHEPSKLIESIFIKMNKSSGSGGKGEASYESLVDLKTINNYSTEFATLTAVHVANALMMQEVCDQETTDFPYLDMLFMRTLNLSDKLPGWVTLYNNIMEGGD